MLAVTSLAQRDSVEVVRKSSNASAIDSGHLDGTECNAAGASKNEDSETCATSAFHAFACCIECHVHRK
jgi:hypothetical protein